MSAAAPAALRRMPAPEDAARADFYALLARLFSGGPDAALLATLGNAAPMPATSRPDLARAWDRLVAASSVMDPEAAADEYETLFIGVGKAEISIYSGFYAGAPAVDHPRVRLQAELARLGLSRRDGVTEPEDHIAGLFEVMRVLVAGGAGREPAPLAEQRRFFEAYLAPAVPGFLAAVGSAPKANYYRTVAALAAAFISVETDSFQLE